MSWHADAELLGRYAAGDADTASAASVEAHLERCPGCRRRLAAAPPDAALERAWAGVVAGIGAPPPSLALRLLRRLGVSDADAVLLRAARSLDGSWTLATIAVIAFAALAAIDGGSGGRALYLLVAPLLPVAGVVGAFASSDGLAELSAATPYSTVRLALLRTAAVCATSVPLVIAFGAAVPPIGWLAVAWLVPALALTVLTLAAMTWVDAAVAGTGAGALWLAVVAWAYAAGDVPGAVGPARVGVYLAVAAIAGACLAIRLRNAHAPGGPR